MKRKVWPMLMVSAVAVSGSFCLNLGRAQERLDEPARAPLQPIPASNNPFQPSGPGDIWAKSAPEPPAVHHAIDTAAAKLRDAESDEERAAATKELAELLDKHFEDDMKHRAEEVARIEERVKKLRDLLEKRAAKKQEIIDLQIKVLENEAAGLGFFSQPGPPHGPRTPAYNEPGAPWGYGPPVDPAGAAAPPAFRGPFGPPNLNNPQDERPPRPEPRRERGPERRRTQ
jgi:hypothetical protein